MTYETLFSILNFAMTPAWIVLIASPWWSAARKCVHNGAYPLAYAAIYVAFVVAAQISADPSQTGDVSNLAGIKALFFERPETLLAAWSHFLGLDLFVGAWIDRDAQRRGVAQWLRIACLLATYVAGPIGLLAYLVGRKLTGKGGLGLDEA